MKALLIAMCALALIGCSDLLEDETGGNDKPREQSPTPSADAKPNPLTELSGTLNGKAWTAVSVGVKYWDYSEESSMEINLIGRAANNPCGQTTRSWYDDGAVELRLPSKVGEYTIDSTEDATRISGTLHYYDKTDDVDENDYLSSYSSDLTVEITEVEFESASGSLTLTDESSDTNITGTFVATKCSSYY